MLCRTPPASVSPGLGGDGSSNCSVLVKTLPGLVGVRNVSGVVRRVATARSETLLCRTFSDGNSGTARSSTWGKKTAVADGNRASFSGKGPRTHCRASQKERFRKRFPR